MKLNNLETIIKRRKKRLGQGHGSGRSKTSGRGTKGQKARGKIPIDFEGGALPLIKRMPFLRGKDRNNPIKIKPFVLNLKDIDVLPKNSTITVDLLVKNKLIGTSKKYQRVKILGTGEITKPMKFEVPVSSSAKIKIEKAGGTISN